MPSSLVYACVYDDIATFHIFGFFTDEDEANKLRDMIIKTDRPENVKVYPYTVYANAEDWFSSNPVWEV